ncbi:MAG TPA: TadE family protein [Bryobacteraceae bacterium]|jgi:Flp pilus assembly protein TadG
MSRRRGNSVLEFALGSGVLLAVFTGTFRFGYTMFQYNRLETAVAQGARYASLVPYDSATTTPSSNFRTAVQNMVLYGSPAAGTHPVLSDLTASNVSLTVTFTNNTPSAMTVALTGYTINGLFGTSILAGKPKVTYPYQGIWAPI